MKRSKTGKKSNKFIILAIVLSIIALWLLNLKLLPYIEKFLVTNDFKSPRYTEKDFIPTKSEENHFKVYYLYKLCTDYKKIPTNQIPKDEDEIKLRSIGYTLVTKFDDCRAFATFPTIKRYPGSGNQATYAAIFDFPESGERYEIQALYDVLGHYTLRFLIPYENRDFCFAPGESLGYKEYRLYNENLDYATDFERGQFLRNNTVCK